MCVTELTTVTVFLGVKKGMGATTKKQEGRQRGWAVLLDIRIFQVTKGPKKKFSNQKDNMLM